jgi:hypothetical protein
MRKVYAMVMVTMLGSLATGCGESDESTAGDENVTQADFAQTSPLFCQGLSTLAQRTTPKATWVRRLDAKGNVLGSFAAAGQVVQHFIVVSQAQVFVETQNFYQDPVCPVGYYLNCLNTCVKGAPHITGPTTDTTDPNPAATMVTSTSIWEQGSVIMGGNVNNDCPNHPTKVNGGGTTSQTNNAFGLDRSPAGNYTGKRHLVRRQCGPALPLDASAACVDGALEPLGVRTTRTNDGNDWPGIGFPTKTVAWTLQGNNWCHGSGILGGMDSAL